jgi:hypothetical protein
LGWEERLNSTNQRAVQAARKPANSSSNREVDMDWELI